MTLAHPWALLGLLLAAPIVLLYRRKLCLPRATLATSMFWDQVLPPAALGARWQRWRDRVSLVAQLVILGLLVVAWAGPVRVEPPATAADRESQAILAIRAQVTAGREDPMSVPPVPSWVTVAGSVAVGLLTCEWCLHQRRWMS